MKPAHYYLTLFIWFLIGGICFGGPIPDSEQTRCYDDWGREISPCPQPGEPFYGQNANYAINPPSYTKLDDQGNALPDSADEWAMVRDNVTGLIWEVKQNKDGVPDYSNPHDADNTYTWYDSNPETNGGDAGTPGDGVSNFDTEQFINALNQTNFGGFSNWRLPDLNELITIVDYFHPGPVINIGYFSNNMQSIYYWTSNPSSRKSTWAWQLSFYSGSTHQLSDKSDKHFTLAVCSQQSQTFGHLHINGDGTVTDTKSGVMWQQSLTNEMTWKDALDHCEDMKLASYEDWRLPSIKEFNSIRDLSHYAPGINKNYFPNTPIHGKCWSSNRYYMYINSAWAFGLLYGTIGHHSSYADYDKCYVQALRGGQNKISGHLFIKKPRQASFWNSNSDMPIIWETSGISGNVKISISYQGGKPGTFETIAADTPNDGEYEWKVPEISSSNCMIKIEPLSAPDKGTVQGLFSILYYIHANPSSVALKEPETRNESPDSETLKVNLTSDPGTDLEISLETTNPGEFTVYPKTVTLSSDNWETGAEITVTPQYDGIADGDQPCILLASTPDDAPIQAKNLPLAQVIVRDSDTRTTIQSVLPAYGQAGQSLDVTVKGTQFDENSKLYISSQAGGAETEITPELINKTTLSATIPGQTAGNYNLRTGASTLENALAFAPSDEIAAQRRKKAIIVAGSGPYYDNGMWNATDKCIRKAYQTLMFQGYSADGIYLLSQMLWTDITGNGENDIDAGANSQNLQEAITDWASGSTDALLLYLVGPGMYKKFQFGSNAESEYLNATTLDSWLDELQNATSCELVVIYDACKSGSFISELKPPRGKSRMVITSTNEPGRANFLNDGELSFSYRLFDHLYYNADLEAAIQAARNDVKSFQTVLVDKNGDGQPEARKRRDGDSITIGRGRATDEAVPVIGSVSSDPARLPDGVNPPHSSRISASEVSAENGLSWVWSYIVTPSEFYGPHSDPMLTMTLYDWDENGEYGNLWENFIQRGVYRAMVYADGLDGGRSEPKEASVTQNEGEPIFDNPPIVASIQRASDSPTIASEIAFTVSFDRPVFGVNVSDFEIDQTTTDGVITSVTGQGAEYTVTIGEYSGEGRINLKVKDDNSIVDEDNVPLGGLLPDDGSFQDDSSAYEIIYPAEVRSITRLNDSPTAASILPFLVQFDKSVAGLDASYFSLYGESLKQKGHISGIYDFGGNNYLVRVSGVSGTGRLRLDVIEKGLIGDDYRSGPFYEIKEPEILVFPKSLTLSEAGESQKLVFSLSVVPQAPVVIELSDPDDTECRLSASQVTLNRNNWKSGVEVTITPLDERQKDDDQKLSLVIEARSTDSLFNQIPVPEISITVQDNPDPLDPGDVNGDARIDLADAVLALQALSGINKDAFKEADLNDDGKAGIEEAVFVLRHISDFPLQISE